MKEAGDNECVTYNRMKMDPAILADAVFQGCRYMTDEVNGGRCTEERERFLRDRIYTAMCYRYSLLGLNRRDAAAEAEGYMDNYVITADEQEDDETDRADLPADAVDGYTYGEDEPEDD